MFPRVLHSVIALATIIVAYQAYVLLAVPWLEPSLALRQGRRASASERQQAAQSVSKYQQLLSNYFPSDHWSQREPPIVLGNGPALLVLPSYTPGDDGIVKIDQFALLVFPTPIEVGMPPPRDAIVLEAPGGATLKFDRNFRLDRGQFGQIESGVFDGPISIRSDMHEPGPDDDLLVETADLAMNTKLLYSAKSGSPVRFRLGANVGSGRELEIRFMEEDVGNANQNGFNIAGVNSLEIRREVRLRVNLETDRLLPDAPRSDAGRGINRVELRGNEDAAQPPVDVTCTGPFLFDFVRYVASFDREVRVRRVDPSGQGDQMIADQLDIHFAPMQLPTGAASPLIGTARRQQRDLTRLEPVRVVAQGAPAVVTSPTRGAEARVRRIRGRRIQLDLRDRRVTVEGGRDTALVDGANILRAPTIEYWHPASEAGTKIGLFRASGPGSLYYVLDPAKPDEVFQAKWQTSVELGRSKGQPVLTLDGRPQLAAANVGSLAANQLTVYFRELHGSAASASRVPLPAMAEGDDKLQLVPDRLAATGQVEITSPGLTARTEELLATFESRDEPALDARGEAAGGSGITGPLSPSGRSGPRRSAYHVESDRIQMGIHLRGRALAPASVACDGHVVFREIPLLPGAPPPLEIRGGQLTASGLDADAARVTMLGAEPGQPPGAQLVQITGRGMKFLTAAVEIDQRQNRLWSEGPGQATILITRDLEGRATATVYPFDIRWQNGMVFDGRLAVFRGDIFGQGPDDTLRCDQLTAKLSAPIEFEALNANADQDAADVAEIELIGQVMVDHRSRDDAGPASHERLQLDRLSINQLTGAIRGEGPGVIRSTRFVKKGDWSNFGRSATSPSAIAEPRSTPSPSPGSQNGSQLYFFRIDFDGHVVGNLYTRELAFNRRVRTVLGPVDSWEQELDANRPETLPPKSLTLECNELSANEDPVAARANRQDPLAHSRLGPIQLRAQGNVRIDGRNATRGRFHAQAMTTSYDQAKQVITLEGDGRTPASLYYQALPGERFDSVLARTISYSLATGLPKVDGGIGGQITPPAPPRDARGPAPR